MIGTCRVGTQIYHMVNKEIRHMVFGSIKKTMKRKKDIAEWEQRRKERKARRARKKKRKQKKPERKGRGR